MLRSCRSILRASALLLLACSSSDENESGTLPDSAATGNAEADRIIDSTLTQMKRSEAETFPCSMFTAADMSAITGTPADSGAYTFENRSEDDREWQSEACGWAGSTEQATDVDVWVSLPKHFAGGQIVCHPQVAGTAVAGLGIKAWWQTIPGSGMGELRVCTDKALFEVKIDRPGGSEDEKQKTARAVATQVLERLR
jgi:hypothetical protein